MRLALQALSEPLSKRVHFFNTFFYKKLTQKNATKPPATENEGDRFNPTERSAHDRVKKWTKHVDIFSKARRCTSHAHAHRRTHAMSPRLGRILSSCRCTPDCTGRS